MFGDEFLKMLDDKKQHFKTGFVDIDDCFKCIPKGSVFTIGGRPAMGKTSFAISICNNLLDMRKKVLFCELDNSTAILERRLISIKTQIPRNSFFLSDLDNQEKEKIEEAINYYQQKHFSMVCKTNMSIEEFEKKVKEENPDIVFVDCVQNFKMPKSANFTEGMSILSKEMKRIATENNLIIVLISQLSRSPEHRLDKHPILSDLRNCSDLENLSDVILFIYRKGYYDLTNPDNKNKAEIIIAKNNFGITDVVPLEYYDGIFYNMQKDIWI